MFCDSIDAEFVDELDEAQVNTDVTYEVWAVGYDEDGNNTGVDLFIDKFEDPNEAVDYASEITFSDVIHFAAEEDFDDTAYSVSYVAIEVETVICDEDGNTVNAGTIYRNRLKLGSNSEQLPGECIRVSSSDYELTNDGDLKISRQLFGDNYDKDYVNIIFIDEPNKPIIKYNISNINDDASSTHYICEFIS